MWQYFYSELAPNMDPGKTRVRKKGTKNKGMIKGRIRGREQEKKKNTREEDRLKEGKKEEHK